jgi:hypothetical protein
MCAPVQPRRHALLGLREHAGHVVRLQVPQRAKDRFVALLAEGAVEKHHVQVWVDVRRGARWRLVMLEIV